MEYNLSNEGLRAAKKTVKMIVKAIIEGMMKQDSIEFAYEEEAIKIYHHVSEGYGKLVLSVYRDGVPAYMLYGTQDLDGIKKMSSDIFFLLSMYSFDVKL